MEIALERNYVYCMQATLRLVQTCLLLAAEIGWNQNQGFGETKRPTLCRVVLR